MTGRLRVWTLGCALGAVVVVAGGYALGVQPALAQAAQTDRDTADLAARDAVAEAQLAALSKQSAKLADMQSKQQVLLKAVPTVLKPNTFLHRVNDLAALDNVVVLDMTMSTAVAYAAPTGAAVSAGSGVAAQGSSASSPQPSAASPQPSAAGTVTAGTPATTAGTSAPAAGSGAVFASTDPLITGSDFTIVPTVVKVSGAQSAVLQFAHDLANDRRVFSVTNMSTLTAEGVVTATLSGSVYTLKR